MKKIMFFFVTIMVFISCTVPAMASDNIKVKLGGELIQFDVQPQLINNRTMVPLRAIFEELGATVEWNSETQTVTSTKGNTTISLTINNNVMKVNDSEVTLDSPACLVDGRTLVPVRAISEAFGIEVKWISETQTVELSLPKLKVDPQLIYNQHGIKITYKGHEIADSGHLEIKILIENDSNQEVTVLDDATSVNDFVVDGMMIETLPTGKKSNTVWSVMSWELEENDITQVDTIGLKISYTYGGSVIKSHEMIIDATPVNSTSGCDHTTIVVKGTPASCEKAGMTDGEKCTKCNEMTVKQKQIVPLTHDYQNGKCILCGAMDSSYTPEYSFGDIWGDEGVWEFTVDSVDVHKLCNSYYGNSYNGKKVIKINYNYKNINFDMGSSAYKDVLSINRSNMDVIDNHGEVAPIYVCVCRDSKSVSTLIKKGQNCKATEVYVIPADCKEITLEISLSLFKNGGVEQRTVKYVLPVK